MIKHIFRGKCIDDSRDFNGKWVYGDLIHSDGKTYIHPQSNAVSVEMGLGRIIVMHEVDPDTVGQWTGLLDKNDAKIFEGDVIEDPYGGESKGIIEYGHHNCGCCYDVYGYRVMSDYDMSMDTCVEVVGNKWENKNG